MSKAWVLSPMYVRPKPTSVNARFIMAVMIVRTMVMMVVVVIANTQHSNYYVFDNI